MDLKLLRSFVAVSDAASFKLAAEQRHVTQPALSMQITTLERELGVTLFERGRGRRVSLTPSGQAFLEGARITLQSVEAAMDNARKHNEGRIGHLRIGFSDDFIYSNFPDVMAEFHRAHANVIVTYQLALSAELVARLRDGLLDLVLACFPLAAPDADIRVAELPPLPIVAAVSRSHPLAREHSIWLKALSEDSFLLFPQNIVSGFSAHTARLFAHARFTPRVAGYIHSTQIMAELAARGVGVGLLTRTSLTADYPGVRFLKLRDRQAAIDSGALYGVARARAQNEKLIEWIVEALRVPRHSP